MNKKKVLFIVIAVVLFCSIMAGAIVVSTYSMSRNYTGDEYKKKWVCSDAGIHFISYDSNFPHFHNYYEGVISYGGDEERVKVYVGNGEFKIGNFINESDVDLEFIEYATGNYKYFFNKLTVNINDTNDEFKYLYSKKLVFVADP